MHRDYTLLLVLFAAITVSGCYHASVVTGEEPSNIVVEEEWHLGFVAGLVVPDDIDVADECPNGVAMVETKLSFMNQLVTFLTGGIFSPMHVTVTCAAGLNSAADGAAMIEGDDEVAVLTGAARESGAQGRPVTVRITR